MPKVKLSKITIYRGRTYGPGDIEVADEATAAALTERQRRRDAAAAEAAAPSGAGRRRGEPKSGGEG